MKRKGGLLEGLGSGKPKPKISKPFNKPKRRKVPGKQATNKDLWNNRRKKGRLIVRNLPFKITEELLREHFSPYGELQDVSLLKRADGKLVGCGFVEFATKENATKAIAGTSGKPLLKRPIIVDWAVPKDLYRSSQKTEVKSEVKEEVLSSDEEDIEDKKPPRHRNEKSVVKNEAESDSEQEVKSEQESSAEGESGSEGEEKMDEEDDSEEDEAPQRPPRPSDVQEGCTIFLKNVPFTATKEELRECMLKFGPVVYALICTDPLTEHSRGTAFVKFQSPEGAQACLAAEQSQLELGLGMLEPHLALEKKQLTEQAASKKVEGRGGKTDGRSLYLIKEGVVQAGSTAAKGVSTADMSKRLQLEQWKTQMLRNLSMVVSRTRLAVHNLPPTLEDEALRKIVKKHAPPGARITEARVMRDLRHVDAQGRGRSKEFGFVSFMQHQDALVTLRTLNNNPDIFTRQRRPIVGFSIDNKAILNAKQRRMEQSRNKNPYYQREKKAAASGEGSTESRQQPPEEGQEVPRYAGLEAHSGQTVRMPSRGTLRSQAATHRQNMQQDKRQIKMQRKLVVDRNERMKQQQEAKLSKVKRRKRGKDDNEEKAFNSLVDKYREKMETSEDLKKWYE